MSLSAEAQHVIDSLEAHFRAVKLAVDGEASELVQHVEGAYEEVFHALKNFFAVHAIATNPTPSEKPTSTSNTVSNGAAGLSTTLQSPGGSLAPSAPNGVGSVLGVDSIKRALAADTGDRPDFGPRDEPLPPPKTGTDDAAGG